MYKSYGGRLQLRKQLTQSLSEKLGHDVLILSGDGAANILVFRNQASKHMKLIASSKDDMDAVVNRMAKVIIRKTKELKEDQSTYGNEITLDNALKCSSPAFLKLMSCLSNS